MAEKKQKKDRKIEKEILYIVGFFVFLVIVFFVSSAIFKKIGQVEYEGLTFTKERIGKLEFYKYSYNFPNKDKQIVQYDLFLRKNPKENNIALEGNNTIKFKSFLYSPIAYITIKTAHLKQCEDSLLAIGTLSQFLSTNNIEVRSGNMDYVESLIHGHNYVTCENKKASNVNVFQIMKSNETQTKIILEDKCYTILVGDDCRIQDAVEKLQIKMILDAKANS